jgi:hypothetical protein
MEAGFEPSTVLSKFKRRNDCATAAGHSPYCPYSEAFVNKQFLSGLYLLWHKQDKLPQSTQYYQICGRLNKKLIHCGN